MRIFVHVFVYAIICECMQLTLNVNEFLFYHFVEFISAFELPKVLKNFVFEKILFLRTSLVPIVWHDEI